MGDPPGFSSCCPPRPVCGIPGAAQLRSGCSWANWRRCRVSRTAAYWGNQDSWAERRTQAQPAGGWGGRPFRSPSAPVCLCPLVADPMSRLVPVSPYLLKAVIYCSSASPQSCWSPYIPKSPATLHATHALASSDLVQACLLFWKWSPNSSSPCSTFLHTSHYHDQF